MSAIKKGGKNDVSKTEYYVGNTIQSVFYR